MAEDKNHLYWILQSTFLELFQIFYTAAYKSKYSYFCKLQDHENNLPRDVDASSGLCFLPPIY